MNENDTQDVDLNNEDLEEGADDKPEEKEAPKETPKPEETPEAKLARLERQADRLRKKLGKDGKDDEPEPKSTKSELGYAEKAYLTASGVKGSKEIALAQEFIANTGKSLEEILESKFFQSELKELRDGEASANAVPKGSKRSGGSSKDTVDYWLAKGELPENTPENQELRRKVVNSRYERETSGSKFASSHSGSVRRQSDLR